MQAPMQAQTTRPTPRELPVLRQSREVTGALRVRLAGVRFEITAAGSAALAADAERIGDRE